MNFEDGDVLTLGDLIVEMLKIQKVYGANVIVDAIVFEPETGHICVATEVPEGHAMFCGCEGEPETTPPSKGKKTSERVTKNGRSILRLVE